MPASRLHFVRHGEVFNPKGLLYERLDGFPLSEMGHKMAAAAATELKEMGANPTRLIVSPLERTRQSAAPVAEAFGLDIDIEERIIEPWNKLKGYPMGAKALLAKPALAIHLYNPSRPSWGEPFDLIAARMTEAALDAWEKTDSADVVFVSHQLPIWMTYRSAMGMKLPHNPRNRRCSLSSITSFEVDSGRLLPVDYREPGIALLGEQA
jgi:broad specificity phosphatase PhoE